jgi:HEAT repeat protein
MIADASQAEDDPVDRLRLTLDLGPGDPRGQQRTVADDQLDRIIELIGNEQFSIRMAAIKDLTDVGEKAVPALLQALSQGLWYTRECAAQILGNIGDPRAVEPLIACLQDENVGVRRSAAIALSKMVDHNALGTVAQSLAHVDVAARRDIVEAVRKISPLAGRRLDEELGGGPHSTARGEEDHPDRPTTPGRPLSGGRISAILRSFWRTLRGHLEPRS